MRLIKCSALAALAFAAGCASSPASQRLEESNAAIQAAEKAGVDRVPSARWHLEQAKEQNQTAQEELRFSKRAAESTLERADADTDLAVQLVREEQSRAATRKAAQQLNQLKRGKEGDHDE